MLSKRHPCKGGLVQANRASTALMGQDIIFYFLIGKFLSPWDLNLDVPQSLPIPLPLEPGFKGMGQDII